MSTYITADQYASTHQAVTEAIGASIAQNEIVYIEVLRMTPETILRDLFEACDDTAEQPTDTGRTVEYWGRDIDGNDWRVHVSIRAEADAA